MPLAASARLQESLGVDAHVLWSDDGIAFHFLDADAPPLTEQLVLDPDEVDDLIMGGLGGTAPSGRARENAARAADPAPPAW